MHRLLALVVAVGCGGSAPAPARPQPVTDPAPEPVAVALADPCDGGETKADPCAGGEAPQQVAIADPCDGGEATGGLGLQGTGEGGGGVGSGPGLGSVGTIGTGSGSGYGSGRPIGRRGPAYLPKVTFGKPTITGTYAAAIVTRTLKRYAAQARYCYERLLNANPTLEGTVLLELTLTPEGGVGHAKATGLAPDLEACLGGAAIRWTFPKPSKGIVKIRVPIAYAPTSGT